MTCADREPSGLTAVEAALLDAYQRGLPLSPTPYLEMAERLGVSERDVLEALDRLQRGGVVSRVGAVLRHGRIGASTLAALAVPAERLEEVAALVSSYREVNHNYEREHPLNLWFVVAAPDRRRVQEVLEEIELCTGLEVLDLPMLEDYHIDLGFPLWT
jgi:DNA-binding Lrp family transcriptional regulator